MKARFGSRSIVDASYHYLFRLSQDKEFKTARKSVGIQRHMLRKDPSNYPIRLELHHSVYLRLGCVCRHDYPGTDDSLSSS